MLLRGKTVPRLLHPPFALLMLFFKVSGVVCPTPFVVACPALILKPVSTS
jgi:hypothetical protein